MFFHEPSKHYHASHDAIAHNTRSKRRDVEDATSPSPNQASNSWAALHVPVMNSQSNGTPQQRQDMSNRKSNESQTSQIHPPIHIVPKALVKEFGTSPFNVVDQMKRTNVNISIWDFVSTIQL